MSQQNSTSSLNRYFARTRGTIKPGAHRLMQLLSQEVGKGVLDLPTVLVGGTNGKGSVCAFLESAFRHCGYKTGLYTSPHLVHPNERIRIAGQPVEESILIHHVDEVERAAQLYLPDASFFEIATAAALKVFRECHVDVLVCEVGLGGKYDSTNALAPCLSVITSVGIDHTEFLGNDLKTIASDKAFISRRNAELILGNLSAEAREGIDATVAITGATLIDSQGALPSDLEDVVRDLEVNGSPWIRMNTKNLRTAVHALSAWERTTHQVLDRRDLAAGLRATVWPGRFDVRSVRGKTVIFDVSHNLDGMRYFLSQYHASRFNGQKCTVLFASLSDKNWRSMLHLLQEIASKIILTEVHSPRSARANELSTACLNVPTFLFPNAKEGADALLSDRGPQEPTGPYLVTGSVAFVGEVMELLGVSPFQC